MVFNVGSFSDLYLNFRDKFLFGLGCPMSINIG